MQEYRDTGGKTERKGETSVSNAQKNGEGNGMPSSRQRFVYRGERRNVLGAKLQEHPSGISDVEAIWQDEDSRRKRPHRMPLEQPRKVTLKAGLEKGRRPLPTISGMQCGTEGATKSISAH